MPEITLDDEFGRAIAQTILHRGYRSAIEIGSWDGAGSTLLLVSTLCRQAQPRLVAIEAEHDRFAALAARYARHSWVECYHGSSISQASLTPQTFGDVWDSQHNRLRYPREQVESWWHQFKAYMATVPSGYLEDHDDTFDVALIDGSEFTGWDEYLLLRERVRCLMLDDVFSAYKCNRAHESLRSRPEWECVWCSAYVRNGAAIWVRS
jgi:hypothetical protein